MVRRLYCACRFLEALAGKMGKLRACFIVAFLQRTKWLGLRIGHGQGQVILGKVTQDMVGNRTAENRAWCDASAVIAGEADDLVCKLVEARQCVVRHTDLAIPFAFELDVGKLRKEPFQRSSCPAPVDGGTRSTQGANAAEHQSAGLVHPERRQDFLGIPAPFAVWQDAFCRLSLNGRVARLK